MNVAPNPFQILTWWAQHTEQIRLGTAVAVAAYWHPIRLAGEAAFVDQLSGGRLEFGNGSGAYQREFDRMKPGLPQPDAYKYMHEMLPVLKNLWAGDYEHDGEYWQFPRATSVPKPVQQPHPPIWFGARVPVALKRAVKYGDGFMGAGSSSTADFIKQYGLIQQYLEEAGRVPETFRISKRVYIAIDRDKDRAERRLAEWFGHYYGRAEMASQVSIWGSRDECLEKLGLLVQTGAKHLMLNPVFDETEHLELLAEEIVPNL